ncbi:Predicted arabinose efflux permease, MFS family [Actinacidiphila rubida]|uniref:Predicted arabinose efflux permease, MFS family n=1 Tax=Actinacidiphila rubida TaxID=310780 RepID=A0A1H8MNK1_9ACTN|nr:MFS transporter [Actinacidiphila rubida]SEO19002.1 Predicted arabinose efflux permease, MFS family [Actinacidiphila rubida]
MPHPLRVRAFRLLFTGRTLSALGDAVVPAALAIAITRADGSAFALALVLGCAMVPRLLLLPLGGVAADRFDARKVALATDLVRCAAQLLVGAELIGGSPRLADIAIAEAVGGIASAFALPTTGPLVSGTAPADGMLRANALMASAASATRLAGPAVAGLLIFTAGPGWAFVLDAASFAASASMLAVIRVPRTPIPPRSLRADLVEGWSEVRTRDWYWSSLIAHCVWNGTAAVLATLGPLVVHGRRGGDGLWVAVLEAGSVGLLLGSLLASRARLKRPILTANLGLATYAAPLLLLGADAPGWLLVVSYGVALGALGFLTPVWETYVYASIPPGVLARVTSYDWLLSLAAMPLGYALAPVAAHAVGTPAPLYVCAALVAAACLGTAAAPGVRGARPIEDAVPAADGAPAAAEPSQRGVQ